MKRRILWIVGGLYILCTACGMEKGISSAIRGDTLRILTYNIHHANPPSRGGVIDLDAIARVINDQHPHLVALQEVDVHTGRSGRDVHEAEQLAAKTGMHAFFAKAIPYDGGEYGIAILSRYPITEHNAYALPSVAGLGGEPRALCTITFTTSGGRKVMMACTHLDVLRTDTNRQLQIKEIVRIVTKSDLPVILAGDMNAKEGSRAISLLDSSFKRTCRDCPYTIPVDQPKRAIDFIMYTPDRAFRVLTHKVIQEPYASDHLPVMSELLLH